MEDSRWFRLRGTMPGTALTQPLAMGDCLAAPSLPSGSFLLSNDIMDPCHVCVRLTQPVKINWAARRGSSLFLFLASPLLFHNLKFLFGSSRIIPRLLLRCSSIPHVVVAQHSTLDSPRTQSTHSQAITDNLTSQHNSSRWFASR